MKKSVYFINTTILLVIHFFNSAQITFRGCETNVLGPQNFILNQTSTTNDSGTIRHTFESTPSNFTQSCPASVCELRMIWSIVNSRWEIQIDNDGPLNNPDYTTAVLYFNTTASFPNPPDLSLGNWIDNLGGSCGGNGSITILIGDVQNSIGSSNSAQTDIMLSNQTINETATGINAIVGNLSTADSDLTDIHTYTLVNGSGSNDNNSFNISGNLLRTSNSLNNGTYNIRIQTDDGTDTFSKSFNINISPEPTVTMGNGVGINTTNPQSTLDISGGVRALNRTSSGTLYECNSNIEGTFGYDTIDKRLKVCTDESGAFEWRAVSYN